MSKGLTIVVVGLGFGEHFAPIYLSHPSIEKVVLVEPNEEHRQEVAKRFEIDLGVTDLAEVLQVGEHVACAVPMPTTREELDRIIYAQKRSGKNYMMMETTVFA